jgi:hypothetical protein
MVLVESAGVTHLRFTQHLAGTEGVGEVGPGREYYLDALVVGVEAHADTDDVSLIAGRHAHCRYDHLGVGQRRLRHGLRDGTGDTRPGCSRCRSFATRGRPCGT